MSIKNLNVNMDASYSFIKEYLQQHTNVELASKNGYNIIHFDDEVKKGYLTFGTYHFPIMNTEDERQLSENNLLVLKTKYTSRDNLLIHYIPSPSYQNLILVFYFFSNSLKELTENVKEFPAGYYLLITTTAVDRKLLIPINTEVDTLSVHIPLKALQSIILKKDEQEQMARLLNYDEPMFDYKTMPTQMKQIFEFIMNNSSETMIDKLAIHENLSRLIKLTFQDYHVLQNDGSKITLKKADIDALIKAEKLLTSDVKEAPSIISLANEAAMSTTKFKNAFKSFFGNSVYKYYLSYCMEVANQLLQKNEMTVSQIAQELGYKNISHFSRLYKRHFGEYPSNRKF